MRRSFRALPRALPSAGLALAAAGVLAASSGAAGPVEPALQRESLPGDAEITYTVVDPLQVQIDAAVAGQGLLQCFDGGGGCQGSIAALVHSRNAALGFTANFSDGIHILGLAVVDHRQVAPANPHTTSLCVGDPAAPGQRPPVTITKAADAATCRTAVSGERIVAAGVPAIEGLADDGLRGHFWWSVEHFSRVERTLVGVRGDGTVVVAVATSARDGVRNGMTVAAAAAWLIAHGAVDAVALDGGHQADVYSAAHGSQVPLERGEPTMQMSLLLGTVAAVPAPPAAGPLPAPEPATPAVPAAAGPGGTPLAAPLRLDGLAVAGGAARDALDVAPGGPALPETGLPGAGTSHVQLAIAGDEPVDLDARWLAAARTGHRLPDLDPAAAAPALPETGVVRGG